MTWFDNLSYSEAYGRKSTITDDTQMTLFTAEGLILSKVRQGISGRRRCHLCCLSSFKSGKMGTVSDLINNSKGCGAVMRMAPVGLVYNDSEKAFHLGCQLAAITNGHPTGYIAAGTFAALIPLIIRLKGSKYHDLQF